MGHTQTEATFRILSQIDTTNLFNHPQAAIVKIIHSENVSDDWKYQ